MTEYEATEELLDFDRAMLDFREMFPQMSSIQIEEVLRKYDGDVSATINELLFENTAPSSSIPSFRQGEDVLTRLRRRRHEINEKLRENEKLIDKVTDVDSARTYEDQQLAYLLEHREVNDLIKEEKTKRTVSLSSLSSSQSRRVETVPERKTSNRTAPKPTSKPTSSTARRRSFSEEQPIPDGPYVGSVRNKEKIDLADRIKGTFKKASGSRISRLFSTP